MSTSQFILLYLSAISILTFILYGIDKWKAEHARWRIPESMLLGLALAGGSIGAWIGMKIWHHKTQHAKFRYGIPAIIAAQILVAVLLYSYVLN